MAQIKLVLDVPGWTADQLRQAVRDIDALDDPTPIAIEHVTAADVLAYIFNGQLGVGKTEVNGLMFEFDVNELSD